MEQNMDYDYKIICETCGCWYKNTENDYSGYCRLFGNIETHKDDECKIEEE